MNENEHLLKSLEDISILESMIENNFEEEPIVDLSDFDFWDVMDLKSILIQLNNKPYTEQVNSELQNIVRMTADSEKVKNLFHNYSMRNLRFALNRYELNKLWSDFLLNMSMIEYHHDIGIGTKDIYLEQMKELIDIQCKFEDRRKFREIMMSNTLGSFAVS